MSKLKRIFRVVNGRLRVITLKGKIPAKHTRAFRESAAIRKQIKKQAAARTSLAEKRISAVNTVRRFIKDVDKFKYVGRGGEATTHFDPQTKKIIKTFYRGTEKDIQQRFIKKVALSKKGLAPETFKVTTKRGGSILVEENVKPIKKKLFEKDYLKIEKTLKNNKIIARDVNIINLGTIKKKKVVMLDLGHSHFDKGFDIRKIRKRLKKFNIQLKKHRKKRK